ncbi:MAG TPA: hypothetical protein VGX76_16930 [Pirellulales bacterium]|nr:hypothetical protein [Pirellulales bacterium]
MIRVNAELLGATVGLSNRALCHWDIVPVWDRGQRPISRMCFGLMLKSLGPPVAHPKKPAAFATS